MMRQPNTTSPTELHYDAFISYRHLEEDKALAEMLQSLLEKYTVTDPVTKKKRHLKIFRDQSELPVSDNLSDEIYLALDHSEFLIILYSATTRESKWCMRELTYFKQQHNNTNQHILPVLLEKEPSEALPPELTYVWQTTKDENGSEHQTYVETEPLCSDIRADTLKDKKKLLKTREHMRIAAPILGLRFDDLYQRQRRIARRKFAAVAGPLAAALLGFSVYNQYMLHQLNRRQAQMIANESDRVAALALLEEEQQLSITMAQQAVHLLPEQEQPDSAAENALKGGVFGELIRSQRDVLHLKTTLRANTSLWIDDVYADGSKIAVMDWTKTLLYDTANGELLFSCDGINVFFNEDATRCVTNEVINHNRQILFRLFDTETGAELTRASFERSEQDTALVLHDEASGSFYLGCRSYSSETGRRCRFYVEFTADGTQRQITDEASLIERTNAPDFKWLVSYAPAWQTRREDFTDRYSPRQKRVAAELESRYFVALQGVVPLGEQFECYTDRSSYYLVNSLTDELVMVTTSLPSYEEKGNQIILHSDFSHALYSINDRSTAAPDTAGAGSIVRSLLSTDGSRAVNLLKEQNGTFRVAYGLQEQAPFYQEEIYSCTQKVNFPFYADSAMKRLAYVSPSGDVVVRDVASNAVLFKQSLGAPAKNQAYAAAVSEDGDCLAVSAGSMLRLYRIGDGEQLLSLDCGDRWSMTDICCLEFSDQWLLIADKNRSVLLPLPHPERFGEDSILLFESGNEGYGMPRFLTADNLLVCTETFTLPYQPTAIYDLSSGENLLSSSYQSYAYDEATKTLVASPFSQNTKIPVIEILQRDETGGFEKIGSFQSDVEQMILKTPGTVYDNGLLLLSNDSTTEIYRVETQTRLYILNASELYLKNGFVYDPYAFGTGLPYRYDLSLTGESLEQLTDLVTTSHYGKRSMTPQERKKYAMDGVLYQESS